MNEIYLYIITVVLIVFLLINNLLLAFFIRMFYIYQDNLNSQLNRVGTLLVEIRENSMQLLDKGDY